MFCRCFLVSFITKIMEKFFFSLDMDARLFLILGNRYTKSKVSVYSVALRRFNSFFGVTPKVCCIAWNAIKNEAPRGAKPVHLLWCLSFLKEYATEHNRRALFGADEKTMREWTWTFVKLLSNMNVVSSITHMFFRFFNEKCLNSAHLLDSLGETNCRSCCRTNMFLFVGRC